MNSQTARSELGRLLQLAYSGELGAIYAYLGHRRSLRNFSERLELRRILEDEIRHRRQLLRMLGALQLTSDAYRERKLTFIGRAIGLLCRNLRAPASARASRSFAAPPPRYSLSFDP